MADTRKEAERLLPRSARSSRARRIRSTYGPWALVAGASRGVGAAYARALASWGVNVVLVARNNDRLSALKQELEGRCRVDTRTVVMDLSDPEFLTQIEAETAGLDIGLVIYNAALTRPGPFLSRPLSDHLAVLDVNCRGPLALSHWAGTRMQQRLAAGGRAGIILMSSMTSFVGSPGVAAYGASKAYNSTLGEAIGHELSHTGVDMLVCNAGVIRSRAEQREAAGFFGRLFSPPVSTPEFVARKALAALGRKRVIIPGARNKAVTVIMQRLFPRRLSVWLMNRTVEGLDFEGEHERVKSDGGEK